MTDKRPQIPPVLYTATDLQLNLGDVVAGTARYFDFLESRIKSKAGKIPGSSLEKAIHNLLDSTYAAEIAFDRGCPVGQTSRKIARFGCATLEECLIYAHSQYDAGVKFNVYKVDIPDAVAVPMALVGYARSIAASKPKVLEAVVKEYWEPQQSWEYWEFLGREMKVLEFVNSYSSLGRNSSDAKRMSASYYRDVAKTKSTNW
jgi:hypothetical protein